MYHKRNVFSRFLTIVFILGTVNPWLRATPDVRVQEGSGLASVNGSSQSTLSQGMTSSAAANLTIDGAVTYQTMNGVGSNVNSWSWKNGELRITLDALVNILGHNIFRVIHDRMVWAGNGSTRPATLLSNLQKLDPATLVSVYEVPDMQDLWNTIGYLNNKGATSNQIMVNFMGWTAPWMGGSGTYGVPSSITNNTQTNQDIATMIASLVYYGHHRRDLTGANQNLSFTYIAPFNESDLNGLEGPLISPSQMNTIYGNIITTLNAMGDTTTRIMGPDTASNPDSYTGAFSAAVRARMTHFSWHDYGGNPVNPAASRNGINADWMTETSKWCDGCDNNQPPNESEWSFGSDTADILLGDIANGFSAVLTWEGFDTFYYHHNSYSAWGHVGCTQNGSTCTTSDTYPRVYSIRGRAWPEATIAKAISPGMARIGLSTNIPNLTALSFYNPSTGRISIVGHNTGNSQITINGLLQNLPTISSLAFYETNSSLNLQRMINVSVNSNLFTASIPSDTFFLLTNVDLPTAVTLANFDAEPGVNDIQINWQTAGEVGLVGFNIYRADTADGQRIQLNKSLIQAKTPGSPFGNSYQYQDGNVELGKTYFYWIVLIMQDGSQEYGPVSLLMSYRAWLPAVR
jgi:O-glycosyl hydrolase